MIVQSTMMTIIMGQQQNLQHIHPPSFAVPRNMFRNQRRHHRRHQQGPILSSTASTTQVSLSSSSSSSPSSSSSTAISTSGMSPPQRGSEWNQNSRYPSFGGYVVARVLPPDVPNDYDQHSKPLANRILINNVTCEKDATGPIQYQSALLRDSLASSYLSSDPEAGSCTDIPTLLAECKGTTSEAGTDEGCLRVDAYLFPLQGDGRWHNPDCDGNEDRADEKSQNQVVREDSIISVTLMRSQSESVIQALKRFELSILKKLKSSVRRPNNKMKTNNNAIDSSKSSTPSQVETTKAAIYIDGKVVENWPDQLSGLVNRQFWQIATKHSMEICLKMSQHTNQIDDDDGNICCMPVECNPPTIVGVFTFEKFNAKIFPGIPVVLEVQSLYDTHVIVDWYVDEKHVMKNSPCYIPTEQDANKRLSVVLTPTRGDHDGRGYQEAYQFSELVSERRPENDLLSIRSDWLKKVTETEISCVKDEKQGIDEENGVSKTQLRVLSYNILADQNAFSMENPGTPYFPWTTVELMDRKRRSPLILHEILSYGADLICLQEVDELVYDTILRPALNHYNYQGFFSMKMATGTREGCAMFFSLKTFQRCKPDELLTIRISDIINAMSSARDIAPEWEENVKPVVDLLKSCPELQETIDNLAHVVQIARLKDLDGRPIIVANTHLFFHPLADHVRVLQCFAIAYQLSIETTMFGAAPFIICGDFNTDLDDCAAILVNRIFPKNFRDVQHCLNTFTWKEEQHCVENDSRHQVNFPELRLPDSVPVIVSGHHTEHPEFTHYVVEYKATLDHILMSSSTKTARLDPIRQAPLPTLSQVTRHTAMPSISFPSDHCSVLVDAIWTKDASS